MLRLRRFFGVAALLVMIVGCGGQNLATDEVTSENGAVLEDPAGFEVIIPEEMERIVSLAPSITTILVDLGLEDRLVAMDMHSAFMLGNTGDLPVFDAMALEVESMIELNPDFIFASTIIMMGNEENDPLAPIRELGIGIAYIPTSESIHAIQEDIRFIATVMGEVDAGEVLVLGIEEEIEAIRDLVDARAGQLVVYFEISPAPDMFSFGRGTFLNEMLELVGAENVFAHYEGWLPVEAESIVALDPDVIFTNVDFIDDPISEILSRPGWEGMSAIQNERVYRIDADETSQPTHRITNALWVMVDYLYGAHE